MNHLPPRPSVTTHTAWALFILALRITLSNREGYEAWEFMKVLRSLTDARQSTKWRSMHEMVAAAGYNRALVWAAFKEKDFERFEEKAAEFLTHTDQPIPDDLLERLAIDPPLGDD